MKTSALAQMAEKSVLAVPLPGGVWTRTGFEVFDGATEAQLHQAVRQMNALNLSSRWALGDLGIAIQDRKRKEYAMQAKALREQAKKTEDREARGRLLEQAEALESVKLPQYTRELAEALDVDEGYWWNCVTLARFYQPSHRCEGLSPAHHEVAMRGAGGAKGKLATAEQWIAQATKDALSASELRKRVNLSLATSRPPPKAAETNPFTELDAADQWCIAHKGEQIGPDYLPALRVRWSALIEFVGKLTA